MAYLAALHWTNAGRKLAQFDDPQEIRHLLQCTQADAVDHIEESCCCEDLPKYRGGKGSPAERLAALRALWSDYDGDEEGFPGSSEEIVGGLWLGQFAK